MKWVANLLVYWNNTNVVDNFWFFIIIPEFRVLRRIFRNWNIHNFVNDFCMHPRCIDLISKHANRMYIIWSRDYEFTCKNSWNRSVITYTVYYNITDNKKKNHASERKKKTDDVIKKVPIKKIKTSFSNYILHYKMT